MSVIVRHVPLNILPGDDMAGVRFVTRYVNLWVGLLTAAVYLRDGILEVIQNNGQDFTT